MYTGKGMLGFTALISGISLLTAGLAFSESPDVMAKTLYSTQTSATTNASATLSTQPAPAVTPAAVDTATPPASFTSVYSAPAKPAASVSVTPVAPVKPAILPASNQATAQKKESVPVLPLSPAPVSNVPVKASTPAKTITPVSASGKTPTSVTSSTTQPVTSAPATVSPSPSATVDLLRSVPLEISGYDAAKSFPAKFSTPEQVIAAINSSPILLLHMEALRRASHDLSSADQNKLITSLHKRRLTNENDLMLGFDYGYAQLVIQNNKTGLFFLRKANDKFQTQFSNLAYGMAQAEADITLEDATPEEMTTRKMDVIYRLGDAVKQDAASHQPGFWPSYVRVIEKLKPMKAYSSFTRRDFSLSYVPYGNKVVPLHGAQVTSIPLSDKPATLLANSMNTSCTPTAMASEEEGNWNPSGLLAQRSANFNGTAAMIQFYPTSEDHVYRVRVTGAAGAPMLSFKTSIMPSIVEDLDGDGVFEIVARQYQYNPLVPVLVYHYTPCGFELDKKVFDSFR